MHTFKSPVLLLLLTATATTVSAWTLDLTATDGRTNRSTGHLATGCIDLSWTPPLNVQSVNFNSATPGNWSDASSFELYVNKGCSGLSYRNGPGNYVLTPARVIKSYKVL